VARKAIPPHPPDISTVTALPEINVCSTIKEEDSPALDPNRVLLRRLFFINEDKSRYISIGFFPSEGYQPRVEFGAAKIRPIKLMEQHVAVLAEHLQPLCTALCANKQYSSGVHDGLYISTTGSYRVAWLHMGPHTHISFKLPDLRYLNYIMPLVQNQLMMYNNGLPDVMTCNFRFSFGRLHRATAHVQQKHPLHTTSRGA